MITEQEHSALASRTLAVDESCWWQFKDGFAKHCPAGTESLDHRILTLTRLWNLLSPHALSLERHVLTSDCPTCSANIQTVAARQIAGQAPLVYGACDGCGLGVLLSSSVADSIYTQPDYYQQRDAGNVGYDHYLAEREYREAKGRRLMQWIAERAARPLKTLLEVGSGFGFTRAGAEQVGLKTAGVDLNPHAAQTAQEIYGQTTFTGTLAEAVAAKAIPGACWDVVLYLFVLEHLPNPERELTIAAQMLSPNGVLALVVPNMKSLEREIFGASYRSFRRDHLWLFSVASVQLLLERAGLKMIAAESECNVRLLRGFLTEEELNQLDADCRSADLMILAEKNQT